MKRTHTLIAGLILAAGIGSAAFAQGGPGSTGCDGMGPMGQMGQMGQMGPMGKRAAMRGDPAQRVERHLAVFKSQLKLTAEQEPLWQAFAEKAQAEAGKGMRAMRDQAADANLTAPERMAKMQALMQERLAAMTGVHESFNRLYGALTAEQKKVADQQAARMGQGPAMGTGGRPGMGPGQRRAPPPPAVPNPPTNPPQG